MFSCLTLLNAISHCMTGVNRKAVLFLYPTLLDTEQGLLQNIDISVSPKSRSWTEQADSLCWKAVQELSRQTHPVGCCTSLLGVN